MTYRIKFAKPTAVAKWSALPRWARYEFRNGWPLLRQNPFRPVPGILDVHPYLGPYWTMRVGVRTQGGGFRGIYRVVGNVVRFETFGPRPVVYRSIGKPSRTT